MKQSIPRGSAVVVAAGLALGPAWVVLAASTLEAQTVVSAHGVVESTAGGFKFPDGSVQVSAAVAGSAPVEDTGVTRCFDSTGTERGCPGTGEDGERQAGAAWPTPRFTDNGDGTVSDNLTGLVWLEDADCPAGTRTWQEALDWVVLLNFTAITCANYVAMTHQDWRLPNAKELASLVDYSRVLPALPVGHPFENVPMDFEGVTSYWSSSSWAPFPDSAWTLGLFDGTVGRRSKSMVSLVWPVRSGQ